MKIGFRTAALSTIVTSACAMGQSQDQARAAANELYSDALDRTSEQAAQVFTPKFGGFIATRYNINVRDNVSGIEDTAIGGQMAYVKLNMTGNVFTDAISYRVQVKFGEADGLAVLDDAYGEYKLEDEFSFRWGQFKLPVLREENVSDTKQLSANRSVMNATFSQSRSQGVMVSYAGSDMRFMASFNDGIRTPNVDFVSSTEADFGFTGRLEWKWDGDWKQYEEFTSWRGSKYFGAVGGAAHYQEGGGTFGANSAGTAVSTSNTDIFLGTGDVMIKGNGWNVYSAVVYRSTAGPTVLTFADYGFLVQGGWFVGPQWELFARYDVVLPDDDRTNDESFNTISFGANRYISPDSHAAKLTIEGLWFLDAQSAGIVTPSSLTGVLASSERNQFALRVQLQLVF